MEDGTAILKTLSVQNFVLLYNDNNDILESECVSGAQNQLHLLLNGFVQGKYCLLGSLKTIYI